MPHPFYMTVTGESQGDIRGECYIQAHEDKIFCQGLKHRVEVPFEQASGSPTGHRVHGKLTIFKVIDRSTPLLAQALCTNEILRVQLEFYRANPAGDGTEEHFFTITLEQAKCVGLELDIPNCLEQRNSDIQNMEYVSFSYGRIAWTYEPDGIENEDEWLVDD